MAYTSAFVSPRTTTAPEYSTSPRLRVTGSDSPVSADWSTWSDTFSSNRASAGTTSPSRTRITSPGTSSRTATVAHALSRSTRVVVASRRFNAAIALAA